MLWILLFFKPFNIMEKKKNGKKGGTILNKIKLKIIRYVIGIITDN